MSIAGEWRSGENAVYRKGVTSYYGVEIRLYSMEQANGEDYTQVRFNPLSPSHKLVAGSNPASPTIDY